MRIVIFDIDGVVFDNRSRLHLIEKNYRAYEDAVVNDPPIPKTIDLIKSFNTRNTSIIFLTGRSEYCRTKTESTFDKYTIPYDKIWMKKEGDQTPSDIYKTTTLKKNLSKDLLECIIGVYDDDENNIAAFRKMGLPAFLVVT